MALIQRIEERGRLRTGQEEEIEDNAFRIGLIARFNGCMTPEQVDAALNAGQRVYTLFSSYVRV